MFFQRIKPDSTVFLSEGCNTWNRAREYFCCWFLRGLDVFFVFASFRILKLFWLKIQRGLFLRAAGPLLFVLFFRWFDLSTQSVPLALGWWCALIISWTRSAGSRRSRINENGLPAPYTLGFANPDYSFSEFWNTLRWLNLYLWTRKISTGVAFFPKINHIFAREKYFESYYNLR